MLFLSVLMIPTLIIPLLFSLPEPLNSVLNVLNYMIILVFILEYVMKLAFSKDRRKYATDKWHMFDLAIIVAAVVSFTFTGPSIESGFPIILRLLRIPLALSLGGRSIERDVVIRSDNTADTDDENGPLMESVISLGDINDEWKRTQFPKDHRYR